MKDLVYKKRDLFKSRGRIVSVQEAIHEAETENRITKNFIYLVSRVDEVPGELPQPEIHINKYIDTRDHAEAFRFRVKGTVYMKQKRFIYRVDYCHGLRIRITWKTHVLSS
ncbi:MAG: hypothetical protein GX606_05745 [Elusimicrobia bacterium]|nr:hypothetical protein [Elusimicrobiota bacterium]